MLFQHLADVLWSNNLMFEKIRAGGRGIVRMKKIHLLVSKSELGQKTGVKPLKSRNQSRWLDETKMDLMEAESRPMERAQCCFLIM